MLCSGGAGPSSAVHSVWARQGGALATCCPTPGSGDAAGCYGNSNSSACCAVLGGAGGARQVSRFDMELRDKARAGTIPYSLIHLQRANHSATLVERSGYGKEIWIIGGQNNEEVFQDCWVLEVDNALTWRQVHIRWEASSP